MQPREELRQSRVLVTGVDALWHRRQRRAVALRRELYVCGERALRALVARIMRFNARDRGIDVAGMNYPFAQETGEIVVLRIDGHAELHIMRIDPPDAQRG